MAESFLDKINSFRQKLDSKIRALASTTVEDAEPPKPKWPEHATSVMTHLGTPYMHIWLDNSVTPAQTCMRLRNGYLIRLDQRITQALAIALLKLPYNTDPPSPPTTPTEGSSP